MLEDLKPFITPEQRLEEVYRKRYSFQEEVEAAYGKEPYELFRRRYEIYADLSDEADRLEAERDGMEWLGATPKEGTYSLNVAREIYQASLQRMEGSKMVMEHMYNKESFDRFVRVLEPYPEI